MRSVLLPVLWFATAALPLGAKPHGYRLVSGKAAEPSFPDAHTCLIQTGSHAIIHWDGFSIDLGETVRFDQLNSHSAVLNRVVGGSQSALMGSLLSNGRVYLINPHGVLIGPGARIEAASFIASTLDILDSDFINDQSLHFSGASDNSVVNLGQISCPSGEVVLIARRVENHGSIEAPEGRVGLGAGAEFFLQVEGPETIVIQPSSCSEERKDGAALVNAGSIEALLVELKSGKNPYEKAIQSSGEITATSLYEEGGRVFLVAESGLAEVSGTIKGGCVHILGEEIHLTESALIDASGKNGGGEVVIDGSLLAWAGPDTSLKADALENGQGGSVFFLSDQATFHYGNISIRGGELGGDGGQAEVSGPLLEYRGFTDGRAPLGRAGNLLLDPNDFVIGAVATTGTFSACVPPRTYNVVVGTPTNQILNTDVNTQLGTCSLTISTVGTGGAGPNSGSITVSSPVSWATTNSLTLTAASFLSISAAVTSSNAATGFMAMDFSANGTSAGLNSGITLSAGGVLTSSGGDIRLVGNASTIAATTHGVNINGGSIVSTAGTISVGGAAPASSVGASVGVRLATVNSITSVTGAINVSGSSLATGGGAIGVSVISAWTTGTTGMVTFGSTIGTVTGCRGGSGSSSSGLSFTAPFSTSGSVTAINQIVGGTGSNCMGFVTSGAIASTGGGDIFITGSSNGTLGSIGVFLLAGGTISTTGAGNIRLIGTASSVASAPARGVLLTGTVSSPSGTISIGGVVPAGATGIVNGVQFAVVNAVTSTTGAINISATCLGTGAGSHGFTQSLAWTTGTSGLVTFGGTITDGTVSVTGCRGGSGTTSHGMNMGAAFSTTGSVTAVNQIVGGTGTGSHGFSNSSTFASTGAGTINITASTAAGGATASHGINIGGPLSTTGAGTIRLLGTASSTNTGASRGVNVVASVNSPSGTISIGGAVPAGATGAGVGVQVVAVTSTTGAINISGTSAASGVNSFGVSQSLAWTTGTTELVTFGSTITDGTVSVTGCRGGSGITSHGINIGAAFSTTGSVTAINQIVGGTGTGSHGFSNSSTFASTGAGTINITASTTAGGGSASHGINIGNTLSTTGAGSIRLLGTASSTNAGVSRGVNIGALVTSPSGTISIGGAVPAGATGTGVGVQFVVANAVISLTGAINISGTSASSGLNSFGMFPSLSWTTGTSGLVTFGGTITDGTVSVTGCRGGPGFTSHGINMGGAFSTAGSVTAVNQIVGGTGTGSHGVTHASTFASTGAGTINITASTTAVGALVSYGINVGGALSTTGAGNIRLIGTGSSTTAGISRGVRIGANVNSPSGTISIGGAIPAGATGTGIGVELLPVNPVTSTTGAINISGRSAASGASSHGVLQATSWTTGTSGLVTFGATITDGTVSVTGCIGGSGATSHGISRNGTLSTTGSITAINQIIGGSGTASHGFNNFGLTTSTGGGDIFITASTLASLSSYGISIASPITATLAGAVRLIGTSMGGVGALPRGVNVSAVVSTATGPISIGGAVLGGTGTGIGVEFLVANAVNTNGAITVSGTSASSGANSHGVSLPGAATWTPGTIVPLTFGATVTDGTASITGCRGGSGPASHGLNIAAALTTGHAIVATNQIVGGSGADCSGFRMSANVTAGPGFDIDITASTLGSGANSYGIHIFTGILSTTGAGDITLNGTGGTGSSTSYGILLSAGGDITTAAGNLTFTGAGGSVGTPAYGVVISGGGPNSTTGNIAFNIAAPSTALGFSATAVMTPLVTGGMISLNAPAEVFAGNLFLQSGNTITLGTVDGPGSFTVITSAPIVVDDPIGSATPLSTIFLSTPMITLSTDVTANTVINFVGPGAVDVVGTSSVTTLGAGGGVFFASTIDGPSDLTVVTETATFFGTVGAGPPLSALSVTGTTLIQVNGDQTVSAGPMSYMGPVALGGNRIFTNNGALGTTFTSSITGNFTLDITAPSTSIFVGGAIDTSGAADFDGQAVTILAGGNATTNGPINTRGGPAVLLAPNGGDVTITSTGASVIINDIDASADGTMMPPVGGNGGNVTLQPNSSLTATPLGLQAGGFLIFNGTIVTTAGGSGIVFGAGGAISFSALGRASPPIAATIYSNFATDESLTCVGASFTMGVNEMMTIYGNVSITTTGAVVTSDIIALDSLSINASSIFLNPRASCQLLDFLGGTYTSPTAHIYSRSAPTFNVAVLPPGSVTGPSTVPDRTFFKLLLFYPDDSIHLNFDPSLFGPAIIQFFEERIVNQFAIANSQISLLLPNILIWPYWQWPWRPYFCPIDDKECQKPFFHLQTFDIESHEFD